MAELYENKEAARERVILIGVCTRENENVEESLDLSLIHICAGYLAGAPAGNFFGGEPEQ